MPFPKTHPALERALTARAYLEPTPVQAAVLADEAVERDLLVSAQTGSGKTVAFGLALASTLLGDAEHFERAGEPLALIIAPTRELALQVQRELVWLYAEAGGRIVSCVGGMDARAEQRQLERGCHIVVGTPGRLRDHLERGSLDSSGLRAVVLDEADEMLDLGFREDLEFILDAAPESRRTLLFSATIAREIAALAKTYQRDAWRIDTQVKNQAHGDIDYRAVLVAPTDVDHAIVNLLRFHDARAAIIFCHTREAVRHLHASLSERGFAAVSLSGELSQSERNHALQALRDGRARVCVATDVAARGLDLPDLSLVIHADLPREKETLLHRSGRTGRAGRKGICILVVPFPRRRQVERLLSTANIKAQWQEPPRAEDIRAQDQQRLLADPILTEETSAEDLSLAKALLADRAAEDIAAALIRLYRARLPAPEELFDAVDMRDNRPDKGPRAQHGHEGAVVWYELNIGRENNADPKWLIPLICRLGHVTKREIGFIKILDRSSKFEIAADVADRFIAAVNKADDKEVRIAPTSPFEKEHGRSNADRISEGRKSFRPRPDRAPADARRDRGERPRGDKSFGDRPFGDRPHRGESHGDRPHRDRPHGDRPHREGPQGDRPRFDEAAPKKWRGAEKRGPEKRGPEKWSDEKRGAGPRRERGGFASEAGTYRGKRSNNPKFAVAGTTEGPAISAKKKHRKGTSPKRHPK